MDGGDAKGVLGGDGGDGGGAVDAESGEGLEVGLDTGPGAGIGAGDGEDGGHGTTQASPAERRGSSPPASGPASPS